MTESTTLARRGKGGQKEKIMKLSVEEIRDLAEKINASDTWYPADCAALCAAADLSDEWAAADGETFEAVVYKAAKLLGVDIG